MERLSGRGEQRERERERERIEKARNQQCFPLYSSFRMNEMGLVGYTAVVVFSNLSLAADTRYWTWIFHAFLWGSIAGTCTFCLFYLSSFFFVFFHFHSLPLSITFFLFQHSQFVFLSFSFRYPSLTLSLSLSFFQFSISISSFITLCLA
jgi:hypothetical protein